MWTRTGYVRRRRRRDFPGLRGKFVHPAPAATCSHRGASILKEMYMSEAFIVAAARTAGGRRGGRLSSIHPADLAACVLDHLVTSTGADPSLIEDVILGCVGQAGQQSQNIARNAVLSSSLPESVPATTVDRQCGSSQQAIHFAAQAVMSGSMDIVIAGGVESMSR